MGPSTYTGRPRSAQGSVEFVIVIGIVALVFLVMLFVIVDKWQEANEFKTFTDVRKVARTLSTNINNLAQQGDGYWRYFYLPPYANGYDYNLSVLENTVVAEWQGKNYATPIVTKDVDVVSLAKGDYNCVMNTGGVIYITDLCTAGCTIKFLDGSENASEGSNVMFDLLNAGSGDQTVDAITVTWDKPAAFMHKISMPGGSVVWDGSASPVSSGQRVDVLDTTIDAIDTMWVKLEFWDSLRQGIDMNGTSFTVVMELNGSVQCPGFSFGI